MYIDSTFPPPDYRLAQVMRVFEALDRDTLAAVIERGIDRLDLYDGDPDIEDDDTGAVLMIAQGQDIVFDQEFPEPDGLAGSPEDAEDDDPAGGEITDEPHDAEEDYGADDKGEDRTWIEVGEGRQGLSIEAYNDDEREEDDPAARKPHIRRIRRTRCTETRYNAGTFHAFSTYRLKSEKPANGWVRM